MREDAQKVFTKVYETNAWDTGGETRDGAGSTMHYTSTIRSVLPDLLKKYNVKSFLDASCGEYTWMRNVDLGDIKYIGADIVEAKIEKLKKEFPDKTWMVLDITEDPLPDVDFWMCRDTIFHFPHEHVKKTFLNFLRSNIEYILISSHPYEDNKDIEWGDFNTISLLKPPFSFPEPIDVIDDTGPGYHIKRDMFVYRRKDMKDFLYFKD